MKKIGIVITSVFLLCACSRSSIIIGSEEALEVCLDSVGFEESDVRNVEVSENDDFAVSFDSNENDYEFKVNKNGFIIEKKVEPLPENKKEEPEDREDKSSTDETDEKLEETILQNCLMNYGITKEQIQEYSLEKVEDGTYKMHITLLNGRKTVTVTTAEGKPISSYYE